jgi:spermidine synthase
MTFPLPPRAEQGRVGQWLFIAAIFASAFLIFLIQPMVGKRILPWFGGAPAVWTLCLAFYQSTLFLGYAYAHLLIRFTRPSLQLGLHASAVTGALIALPVLPSDAWEPQGAGEPIVLILAMLLANVALPFMVLASTGPLVQAWFARCYPLRSPYPLYAVSNVGSLLALLGYPVLLEPRLPLSETGTLWSFAFLPTAAAVLGCATMARRPAHTSASSGDAAEDEERVKPAPAVIALWLLLSGAAVVMLMAITNILCLDVASVPFLWILPLATYLVTFILCFASKRTYRRVPYVALFAVGLWLTVGDDYWISWLDPRGRDFAASLHVQIPKFCTLLFASCMIMHGELYRLRPPTRSLTAFYLCVSGGGALGGLFVGVLAPLLFGDYFEFELGLSLVMLLLLAVCANDRSSILNARAPAWRWAIVGPLALGVIGFSGAQMLRSNPQVHHQQRGFFGVLRVMQIDTEAGGQRHLMHGSTLHGVQFLDRRGSSLPTSYYGRATGLGMALDSRGRSEATRLGVIGLGVGTLAAYARAGDLMRFYEIDPAVIHIARDSGDFSYLRESPAEIEIALGDARVALAREQARDTPQDFDVLIVDAFNSDAVPVHLLTHEAFEHYVAALAPDGLLAVHVSGRHFDLLQLVARMGLEVGLESIQVLTRRARRHQSQRAKWVLLARDGGKIHRLERKLEQRSRALGLPPAALDIAWTRRVDVMHVPVWTDDYSNLFSFLIRRW